MLVLLAMMHHLSNINCQVALDAQEGMLHIEALASLHANRVVNAGHIQSSTVQRIRGADVAAASVDDVQELILSLLPVLPKAARSVLRLNIAAQPTFIIVKQTVVTRLCEACLCA